MRWWNWVGSLTRLVSGVALGISLVANFDNRELLRGFIITVSVLLAVIISVWEWNMDKRKPVYER
jgi:membrane protein DedA with SNARE-associated domain